MMTGRERKLLEAAHVSSSVVELKHFKESVIFVDFTELVEDRMLLLARALEEEESTDEIRKLQGALQELRRFLVWPDILIQTRQMEDENGERSESKE